jgi:hypothetical protein
VLNLVSEAKAEEKSNPMTADELLAESERLARHGAQQAKKLGIKAKNVDRLIHEYRKERRAIESSWTAVSMGRSLHRQFGGTTPC